MTMPDYHALIGHTGFVGGFLNREMRFTHRYHRANLDQLGEVPYQSIVCAGMPAAKWLANLHPDDDAVNTDRLIAALDRVTCENFVLISTIDVYPEGVSCDESCEPKPAHAYGINRRRLELFVLERYPHAHIIRLPALFGPGLKKNALFDLMHDNQVEKIHPDAEYQWYDLIWLPFDIARVRYHGLTEANLFPEPIAMREVRQAVFPSSMLTPKAMPAPSYRHHTMHSALQHTVAAPGYYTDKASVLRAMHAFVTTERLALAEAEAV